MGIEGMVFLPVAAHFLGKDAKFCVFTRNFRFSEFLLLSRFDVKLKVKTGGF